MNNTPISGQWSGFSGQWTVDSGQCRHSSTAVQPPAIHCPLPTAHCPRSSRSGISLLEVLTSIFVLAFGLLGVLSIIPVGQFAISESSKSDFCGVCGRAALREIKVRGMCDYRYWYWDENAWGIGLNIAEKTPLNPLPDFYINVTNCLNVNNIYYNDFMPFLMDPLGYARDTAELLPHQISHDKAEFATPSNPPADNHFVLARRTLYLPPHNGYPSYYPANVPIPLDPLLPNRRLPLPDTPGKRSALTKIFSCPDDMAFDVPEDNTLRPKLFSSGAIADGNYTWFFTVSPVSSELSYPVGRRKNYLVSAAVCFKRNFAVDPVTRQPAGERTVRLKPVNQPAAGQTPLCFPGMGISGGTVVLESTVDSYGRPLDIKNKQWVLLVRRDITGYPLKCAWYRVVNQAMDILNDNNANTSIGPTVTLAGPDWDTNVPDPVNKPDILIVIDGVIGVYTTTVNLTGN